MRAYILILFSLSSVLTFANTDDSLNYNLYKDKVVLYSDLGYSSAPFNLKDNYQLGVEKLKFRHNQKVVMGFGVAYKWFALRIGVGLPGTLRSASKYGRTSIQDLGVKFNIKKTFWDIDFRNYKGYVIKDAYKWNDTLNSLYANAIVPEVRSASFSINSWYFKSKNFMQSVLGKVGDFKKSTGTWYFKSTLNLFGIGSDKGRLTPDELIDSTQTKSFVNTISALDLGLVPGYAYVHRVDNWQISAFAGLGGVIQSKFYAVGAQTRGFLGLAPRIDLRFIAGYSKSRYFIWFTSEFDVKSISLQELKFNQTYHALRIVGGFRFNKKKKEKKRD